MRENLVRRDLVECVLGLGPGLFYNSPMEACVVICRTQKPKARKGKVLFIDAVNEIARERAQSFLKSENQSRILMAYRGFAAEPESLVDAWSKWKADGAAFWKQMDDVTAMLDGLVAKEASDG